MKIIAGFFVFAMAAVIPGRTLAQDYPKNTSSGTSFLYMEKAKNIFDLIITRYRVPGSDFLLENYPPEKGDKKVAYMWSLSGMVTAMGILRQLGVEDSSFAVIEKAINGYWSDTAKLPGVESYPPQYGGGKRFYDDNATIGLDYLENFKATGRQFFLEQAEKCMAFDYSGESADCGGGLFWDEQEKTPGSENYIKATCASSFATTLALKLYLLTKRKEYLDFGTRMYKWLKINLQDPDDLIYWNDIAVEGCVPDKTKWTYNTGAMITNAVLLYRITKQTNYFTDAKILARASFDYFTKPSPVTGRQFPDHDPWFTTVLFRSYLDFYKIDPSHNKRYIDTAIRNVDEAWKNARTEEGFFYEDWSGVKKGRYQWLLNQACMVEMLGRIALYKKNNEQ